MTDLQTKPPVPVPPAERGERADNPVGLAILVALVLLAGFGGGWPLLLMIAAILVMVFLHELGHFLTAKWAGMKVTEFFIGFGPRIWSFRRGETEYGIKPLPLGAYVKIVGMHNLDEYDPADVERTYLSKPFWRRLSVVVAGSAMHFLLAFVVLFVAYSAVGLEGGRARFSQADADAVAEESPWTVLTVSEDSAAGDLGLVPGDRIISIDGVPIDNFGEFTDVVRTPPDEVVVVVYEHDGDTRTAETTIGRRPDDETRGFFGVSAEADVQTAGIGAAISNAGGDFVDGGAQTFDGLAHILSPSGLADLGRAAFSEDQGPVVDDEDASGSGSGSEGSSEGGTAVGLIGITDGGAGLLRDGRWGDWLTVFAQINIFIGIFNLLPMLPLDGGHVAIAIYEKIRSMAQGGRPYHVDVMKLLPVTYAAVMVLIFLGVSTIVLDTRSLVGG